MMTETTHTLTAANDSPGGPTHVDIAVSGLVTLLARAELSRSGGSDAANSPARPDTTQQRKGAIQ